MTRRQRAARGAWCLPSWLLVAALTGCGSSTPPAQETSSQPPASAHAGVHVFVSDETGGNVVVIDAATDQVIERIAVGKRPRGLRVSRDGTRLFVALSGSPIAPPGVDESTLPPPDRSADGIGVVDLTTRKLLRTVHSGQDPESFDISPDGKRLYVSNEETAEMTVLEIESGTIVTQVKVGEEPEGVTVRPDGRVVYVTCEADGEVVAVDTTSHQVVARIKTGPRPRSIVFTPDGARAFVTNENDGTVSVVDAQKHAVISNIKITPTEGAPTVPRPMGVVLSPDGRQIFVTNGRETTVSVIDVASGAVTRTVTNVGTRPWGIDVTPDGAKLFTANGPSGNVSVINVASGSVERQIETGGSPWGVSILNER